MHELGIMSEVVRIVREKMEANHIEKVDEIVLEVGEIASVVPHYLEECFPAACYKTPLEDCKLKLEIVPANGRCQKCGKVFNIPSHGGKCPNCLADMQYEILSGRDFVIKEIIVAG